MNLSSERLIVLWKHSFSKVKYQKLKSPCSQAIKDEGKKQFMWQIWFWDYKNVYTLGSMYALIQQNIYSQCLATWKKTCISKLSMLKGPRNKQVHFWLKVYKLWTKKYVFKNLLMWFIDVNFSHSWSLAFGPFHAKTQNRSEMSSIKLLH